MHLFCGLDKMDEEEGFQIASVEIVGQEKVYFIGDISQALSYLDKHDYLNKVGSRLRMYDEDGAVWHEEIFGDASLLPECEGSILVAQTHMRMWLVKAQRVNGELVCAGCGWEMPEQAADVDHIRPKSDKGTDSLANRVLLCRPCNVRKAEKFTLAGLRSENRLKGKMVNEYKAVEAFENLENAKTKPMLHG